VGVPVHIILSSADAIHSFWIPNLQGKLDLIPGHRPASSPSDPELAYGRQVFMTGPCALCHTFRGSYARGQLGPDLTHVGTRGKLAAATSPNKLGELEAWITDAQLFKPGTKMPSFVRFNGRELRSLAAYVASLR
jgi:cytochrome c oxidase subunit 2